MVPFSRLYPLSRQHATGVSVWDGENCYTCTILVHLAPHKTGRVFCCASRGNGVGKLGIRTGKLLHLQNFCAIGASQSGRGCRGGLRSNGHDEVGDGVGVGHGVRHAQADGSVLILSTEPLRMGRGLCQGGQVFSSEEQYTPQPVHIQQHGQAFGSTKFRLLPS